MQLKGQFEAFPPREVKPALNRNVVEATAYCDDRFSRRHYLLKLPVGPKSSREARMFCQNGATAGTDGDGARDDLFRLCLQNATNDERGSAVWGGDTCSSLRLTNPIRKRTCTGGCCSLLEEMPPG